MSFCTLNETVLLATSPPLPSSPMNLTLSSPVQSVSGVRIAVLLTMSIVMCFISVEV